MFEVRVNPKPAGMDFYTIACISDEPGFAVASVILVGKEELGLIDCQWTLSNGHRVLAEILELKKPLTTIYVTHAHPDHFWGIQPIIDHFPDAKVLCLPDAARIITKQFDAKIAEWSDFIGRDNLPAKPPVFTPLTEPYFMFEGHKIEVYTEVMADLKYNTVVCIPDLSTFIGSDLLFNQAHVLVAEVTEEERLQWLEELDRFQAMHCETVIPGHTMHGLPFDESSFEFTRAYLKASAEELKKCKDMGEYFFNMIQRFPDAGIRLCHDINSKALYGLMEWNWRED